MTIQIRKKRLLQKEKYLYLRRKLGDTTSRYEIVAVAIKHQNFFDGWDIKDIITFCEQKYGKGVYRVYKWGGNPPITVIYEDPKWKEMR